MAIIGRKVAFAVKDVYFPAPTAVLGQLHGITIRRAAVDPALGVQPIAIGKDVRAEEHAERADVSPSRKQDSAPALRRFLVSVESRDADQREHVNRRERLTGNRSGISEDLCGIARRGADDGGRRR